MDLVDTLLLDIILKFYVVAVVKVAGLEILFISSVCRWIKLNLACW